MAIRRFTRSEKIGLGLWMLALDEMSQEAIANSGEAYPEDSEFACHWWNDIYDVSEGRAWYWAMSIRDRDRLLLHV